jgi:hypothetical protein
MERGVFLDRQNGIFRTGNVILFKHRSLIEGLVVSRTDNFARIHFQILSFIL